jgi:hypothetical protein
LFLKEYASFGTVRGGVDPKEWTVTVNGVIQGLETLLSSKMLAELNAPFIDSEAFFKLAVQQLRKK